MSRSPVSASPIYEPLKRSDDDDYNPDLNTESPSLKGSPISATSKQHGERAENESQKSFDNDWYVWEFLGVAISGGILIATVVVLASYNNAPEPKWKYMSLNSLISWLSTISKGCLISAISGVLGQLKWTWFKQTSRPLPDLRRFDTASRGFYGAIQLIWRLRARHFAVWSCLAVILALGFDPFVQNLVHYQQKMVVDSSKTALVANSSTYSAYGFQYVLAGSGDTRMVDSELKSNVYNSLLNRDQKRPWAIPQYSCSSANCTWGVVASLETRALCANITEHLDKSCTVTDKSLFSETRCNITLLKSNVKASFQQDGSTTSLFYAFVSSAVDPEAALVYTNATMYPIQFITPRLANISVLADPIINQNLSLSADGWEATECVIEPVVRLSRPSVRNNVFTDDTLAIWNTATVPNDATGWYFYPPWGDDMGVQPNQTFILEREAEYAIRTFLWNILSGGFSHTPIHQAYQTTYDTMGYAASDILQALGREDIVGCSTESAIRLRCAMENIAAAISKTFRDSMYIQAASNLENANMTPGHVLTSVTYVSVHWQWIVLPALVWILGAVALVGTIWKTRRTGVPKWRNDPLPLLFLYRHETSAAQRYELLAQIDSGELNTLRGRLHDVDGNLTIG
ncbi:uncharacterized protein N7458_007328 [Penicillium daleae]|uniref:Uncharacterized protein n=1 Tax=Penicillium daleae TaxID=63821 RepID=A0AAD6G125_9EURO|nr:uncharacterized protein N7458_007328 [Penicillium daleae]KAJ5443456.1 hypothetical protein N7458_007328 [Penicillium daleae]